MQLAARQREFALALLEAELPAPSGLVGPDGEASARRFAVYRNNVVAGLIEALRAAFPAVHRIVGADFFFAMARAYVVNEPPTSPVMLDYGAGLADFIARFEPAATLPYLVDVARIERAWSEAYHAPEASPIDASRFLAIAAGRLPAMRLVLHPSLRVVRSPFPALTIWHMNVGEGVPEPVELSSGEDTLVVRPKTDVEVRSIPKGSADFIETLAGGRSVTAALQAALAADPGFHLANNLSGLMRAGAFVGYNLADEAIR
jgi:putative DNA-binding protein